MGKFLRKRRRADVAVLEGCLGVRTRATKSAACKSVSSMKKEDESGGQEAWNPRPDQENSQKEELHDPCEEPTMTVDSSSVQESRKAMVVVEEEEEEEEEDEELGRAKRSSSNSSPHLRESHSDSCLRSRIVPIGVAHSRSNSASFSYDQAATLMDHPRVEEAAEAIDLRSSSLVDNSTPEASTTITTKEVEPSSCCGDNTIVLFASQTSSVSCQDGASVPASVVELKPQPCSSGSRLTARRPRSGADCGPAWRHRVAASAPTRDEIEEFFAGVEEKDDSSKRFVDKYNFDVFNDVPLSGRFEWVQFHPRCS
ncbi:hypothetical protein SELMODRAFT_451516 [Selaginella moellendorffii]|uniref:Uncharacterized protein KRP2-2 n=1 Tax=Selaginella moellendorffii TaxID=88036 RepID=D8S4G1_SELML|nr:cyclin-dependent kinase inhibitor 6 isoform X2 [Selaginella moellendorffii]EFJ20743.1 hypothetical protein SELMODRAFT_451516 [Selaginella moellendorffii]|eukprot:XP_002978086.1 cyclin-dependent kinase inhibitor 6 isoform X2 [Selaginella moellendorffii]